MANFLQLAEKAKKLTKSRLEKDLFDYIRRLEHYILDFNKYQIQDESEDIYGNALGFYSEATQDFNPEKVAGSPFTGYDSGKWLNSFALKVTNNSIKFYSKDIEKSKLIANSESWLSDELYGLTDENLQEVISEKLLPFFIQNFRNILDL